MYKFSVFFQYKVTNNKIVILLWTKEYNLTLNSNEIKTIINFINTYLGLEFSKNDFTSFTELDISEKLFSFFLKINAIISIDNNISEINNWAKLTYNPNILSYSITPDEANILCNNQHKLWNKNLLTQQSWIIFDLLNKRKSYRKYVKNNFDEKEIKYLFDCMYWNIRQINYEWFTFIHKTSPSWGAFYSLNIYFFRFNENSISVLKYDWYDFILLQENISKDDFIDKTIISQENFDIKNAIWFICIFSNLEFIAKKYWAKAHQLTLLEWWHISQNFVLAGLEKWYWTCELWWVYENNIIDILWLDWSTNLFINAILFWKI